MGKEILNVDTILHARWIVPAVPEGKWLEHHSLIIKEGRILDILPTSEARSKYATTGNDQSGLDDFEQHHILIPGLINMHTHTAMTLLRGYADDIGVLKWLQSIWKAEKEWVGEDFVRTGVELGISEMIRTGTTTFNDMYFYPEVTAKVAEDLGMRAFVGIPIIKYPNNWASGVEDAIEKGLNLYKSYKENPLVSITLAPHSTYTVDNEHFQKIRAIADETNMKIHIHLHETKKEVDEAIALGEGRPISRLDRLDLFRQGTIAVHMTDLTPEEIELAGKNAVSIVHCPESNLKLCSGICPVKALINAGVNMCIGTDGAASNDDLDLLGEMRTAALIDKMQAHDETAVPATAILSMATINAAKALGMEREIGSLEVGKSADVCAIWIRAEPVFNPISNLIYVGTNTVTDVWVRGERLLKSSQLTRINEKELLSRCSIWAQKIMSTRNGTA